MYAINKHAFIFDFDGVLLDSMEAHYDCLSEACAEVGIILKKQNFYKMAGTPTPGHVVHSAQESGVAVDVVDVDAVCSRYSQLFQERLDDMDVVQPVSELVRCLHEAGFKTAIASSSPLMFVQPFVNKFELPVDAIVTIDDVSRGKPDPEIFLEAASRLGMRPNECLVIEDSPVGIEAARKAGMHAMRFFGAGAFVFDDKAIVM